MPTTPFASSSGCPRERPERTSLVVVQKHLPKLNIRFQDDGEVITAASGKITLRLSKTNGAVQFFTGTTGSF